MLLYYIDPGTGSMLFAVLISGITALVFGVRTLFLKMKTFTKKSERKAALTSSSIPFLIFSDSKRYRNVFEGIIRELDKRGESITYWTFDEDDPLLSLNLPHVKSECIGSGNKAFARLNIAKADIVLSTTPHLDVYQWKRSKSVKEYVHIPHTVDDLSGYRMFALDHYDTVLITGDNQKREIEELESIRPLIKRKTIVSVGSPQFDILEEEYRKNKRVTVNDKPVVLVAPTWGKSGILSVYGGKLLKALQNTGYEIIVRPHPQSVVSEKNMLDKLKQEFPDIEWNFDNNNFDVQNRSDIMITDFSGIIFEYSLVFNKPVIYSASVFDSSVYDASWMSEEMWSVRKVKMLGTPLKEEEFDTIKSVIDNNINSQSLASSREEIKNECYVNRGNAVDTICTWLIAERSRLTKGGC